MYKKAAQLKLRFQSDRGSLTTEDLLDLTVNQLDKIYKHYNKKIKESEEDSLLTIRKSSDSELQLRIDIIKDVVADKITEADKAKVKAVNRLRKNQLMDLIARKQDEALGEKSVEELMKELDELED